MTRHIEAVPQRFFVGLVEANDYSAIARHIERYLGRDAKITAGTLERR